MAEEYNCFHTSLTQSLIMSLNQSYRLRKNVIWDCIYRSLKDEEKQKRNKASMGKISFN